MISLGSWNTNHTQRDVGTQRASNPFTPKAVSNFPEVQLPLFFQCVKGEQSESIFVNAVEFAIRRQKSPERSCGSPMIKRITGLFSAKKMSAPIPVTLRLRGEFFPKRFAIPLGEEWVSAVAEKAEELFKFEFTYPRDLEF